jgi:hypothetical protein
MMALILLVQTRALKNLGWEATPHCSRSAEFSLLPAME